MKGEGGKDGEMVAVEVICSGEVLEFGGQVGGADDEIQDVGVSGCV